MPILSSPSTGNARDEGGASKAQVQGWQRQQTAALGPYNRKESVLLPRARRKEEELEIYVIEQRPAERVEEASAKKLDEADCFPAVYWP